jgi:hypothetical protein
MGEISIRTPLPKVEMKRIYSAADAFIDGPRAWPLISAIKAILHLSKPQVLEELYRATGAGLKEAVGFYYANYRGGPQIFLNPNKVVGHPYGYAVALLHEFLHHITECFVTKCMTCKHRFYCPQFRATPPLLEETVDIIIDTLF